MNELVSIVVPVYRVEQYLERCIQSIVKQTYTNLEIILVDDGSDDGCPEICDKWALQDKRIVVIHRENGGLSAARNSGIDIAKGEYIAFVDSDDFIAEDFIEALYHACKLTDSEIAQCRYEYVSGDVLSKSKEEITEPMETFTGKEMIAGMSWKDGAYNVVAWNKLYKRTLFDTVRYPEGRIHEDEATTHKLFYRAKKAAFIYRFLYGYYTQGESITRNQFSKKRLDWEWAVKERILFLKEQGEKEILTPMFKIYMDGTIDLYYKAKTYLKDKTIERELFYKLKSMYKELKKHGGTPWKTRVGYRIFLWSPRIYKVLVGKK